MEIHIIYLANELLLDSTTVENHAWSSYFCDKSPESRQRARNEDVSISVQKLNATD